MKNMVNVRDVDLTVNSRPGDETFLRSKTGDESAIDKTNMNIE